MNWPALGGEALDAAFVAEAESLTPPNGVSGSAIRVIGHHAAVERIRHFGRVLAFSW